MDESDVFHVELRGKLSTPSPHVGGLAVVNGPFADARCRDPEQRSNERMALGLLNPLRASTKIRARLAVDAPVTMLRCTAHGPGCLR